MSPLFLLFVVGLVSPLYANEQQQSSPPHCTKITKATDYTSNFRFDYPSVYITPGQREAFQPLHCTNPPTVSEAATVVCDWAAPPLVQFTLGDEYVHVFRQDPTGRYLGNAVITTYQKCNHNVPPHRANETPVPTVSKLH